MPNAQNPSAINLLYKNREEVTDAIIIARKEKSIEWKQIAQSMSVQPALAVAICLGQMSTDPLTAVTIVNLLGLDSSATEWLTVPPYGGTSVDLLFQDPFLHRLCEVVSIYGPALKALSTEMFGDGLISTTDFSIDLHKMEHPQGVRVAVDFEGKFIPYRVL